MPQWNIQPRLNNRERLSPKVRCSDGPGEDRRTLDSDLTQKRKTYPPALHGLRSRRFPERGRLAGYPWATAQWRWNLRLRPLTLRRHCETYNYCRGRGSNGSTGHGRSFGGISFGHHCGLQLSRNALRIKQHRTRRQLRRDGRHRRVSLDHLRSIGDSRIRMQR